VRDGIRRVRDGTGRVRDRQPWVLKSWRHRHLISPHPDGSMLRDEIEFELPLGPLGAFVASLAVIPRLEKLFEYIHRITREWCGNSS
jgi:ligand-binding SRPBCC domain-containing protein